MLLYRERASQVLLTRGHHLVLWRVVDFSVSGHYKPPSSALSAATSWSESSALAAGLSPASHSERAESSPSPRALPALSGGPARPGVRAWGGEGSIAYHCPSISAAKPLWTRTRSTSDTYDSGSERSLASCLRVRSDCRRHS